jgi:hypothetical protein
VRLLFARREKAKNAHLLAGCSNTSCPSPKFLRAIKSMRYEDRPGDWIDVICPSFCPALHHGPVLAVAFLTHSGLLGNFDLSVSELLGFATVVDSD